MRYYDRIVPFRKKMVSYNSFIIKTKGINISFVSHIFKYFLKSIDKQKQLKITRSTQVPVCKQRNIIQALLHINFMNSYKFLLAILLLFTTIAIQTQAPEWITNPNIDAGEIVAVTTSTSISTPNITTVQRSPKAYNKTNFAITPKVILSLIGYTQTPPTLPTSAFGFRITIFNVNTVSFTYNITVYGSTVYALNYLYLAVQYDTNVFYTDIVSLTFSASSNLANATATQRWQTFTLTNPNNWINTNFIASNTQIIAFPIGYQLVPQSGWSYFGINASILSSTTYSVNVSTSGNNILNLLDFSIITFNKADIMSNYTVFIDLMTTKVIGNTTYFTPPIITGSNYMYRNCLAGAVDITFNIIGVSAIAYYYNYSSANDDLMIWRTFNNRVRTCPTNLSYYNPSADLCQDMCAPYYYVNSTFKLCIPCAYSCYNCSTAGSYNSCTACSALDYRTLSGSFCVCNTGYYQNGFTVCASCNYRCLTCNGGLRTSCLTCSSTLFRSFNSTTNQCQCSAGYYENNVCLTCKSYTNACTTCTYNVSTSLFKCLSCNSTLFRVLDSTSTSCLCQTGYFQDSLLLCQPCTVDCISCIYNGTNSICSACDSSLMRTMGASNLTCDCITGYYQNSNNICTVCAVGCLSCSYNGTAAMCSACDTSLNRIMGSANLTCQCKNGFYLDASNNCSPCPIGCLSCTFNGTMPICSNCDSTLNRSTDAINTSCPCLATFYSDNNSNNCMKCPLGCLSCSLFSSNMVCSSCDSFLNRILGSSNSVCPCNVGFYQNQNSICVACSTGCIQCQFNITSSLQICLNCNANMSFHLQNSSCVCAAGTLLNGINCINITNTTSTTNNNNTNSTNNTNITVNNCGNGLLQVSEACDDGNAHSQDGCSSACQVEQHHTCINNNTLFNVSLCYYSRKIQLTPSLIYKIPGKNSVQIQMIVIAPLCNPNFLKTYLQQTSNLALFDKTRLLFENESQRVLQVVSWISVPTKSITYDPATYILTIVFDYDATIDLSQKYIQFIPSSSTQTQGIKYFYASPTAQLTLSKPYNNLSTKYYSDEELSSVQKMKYLFLVLIIFYWLFFLVAVFRKKGVIGTECMLVLQIVYLTLIDQQHIAESWSGLQKTGRYTLGFNQKFMADSFEPDLYALQMDSNLVNVLNFTVGLILILFLSLVGYKLYYYIEEKKRIKKLMQINQTQEVHSTKHQKFQQNFIDRVMVHMIDALLSLLFLAVGVVMVVVIFTKSSNIIYNIAEVGLIFVTSVIFWILFYRNQYFYAFSHISYVQITINANKTKFNQAVKFIVRNYYIIVYCLWMISAFMISVVRKIGLLAYCLIIIGCMLALIFHAQFKIYFELLHSRRCIINTAALIILMVISLLSSLLYSKIGTGQTLVITSFSILVIVLIINVIIFVILERKQLKREKQQQIHEEQMKHMDNQLALANISFIGKGHQSINKSRDFTKDKDFLNSIEHTSDRKKMLLDDQVKIFNLIEGKIKELKDFKKNMQAQMDSSRSQQTQVQNSENNATIDNVLGELGYNNMESDLDRIDGI